MRRRGVYMTALGGVLCALAVTVISLGSIIPLATFVSPVIAAACVMFFCVEYNMKAALTVYAAVSILSVIIASDKEQALVFAFVVGYYPVLKTAVEKLKSKFLQRLIKFCVFNATSIGLYVIITKVLIVAAVKAEFESYSNIIVAMIIVLANITLVVFDIFLAKLSIIYIAKIRPKIIKQR